jgi:hypothetical protein
VLLPEANSVGSEAHGAQLITTSQTTPNAFLGRVLLRLVGYDLHQPTIHIAEHIHVEIITTVVATDGNF